MSEMSDFNYIRDAVDEVFDSYPPEKPEATLLHRTHEKYVDTFGNLVLLGGAAVYQAAAVATQAVRNMRKQHGER